MKPENKLRETPALAPRTPAVDVLETPEGLELWADLPGVPESAVEVELEDDVLLVRGTPVAASDSLEDGAEKSAPQREGRPFLRRFRLFDPIDPEGIEAHLKAGVLRLKLPFGRPRSRRVEVRTDGADLTQG